jgi:hypothetical protein
MSVISPYDEALHFIKRHPGTGGASSLAKLVLSLYNDICGYSFSECISKLDEHLIAVALRMVQYYALHGETDDLRAVGRTIRDELYPQLWEVGIAMRDARQALRNEWEAEERMARLSAFNKAEAALFSDVANLIPAAISKQLLTQDDSHYAYYNSAGTWRDAELARHAVHTAIDLAHGAELSSNCPELGQALVVRIDGRVYYVSTDYDAREAYLETIRGSA